MRLTLSGDDRKEFDATTLTTKLQNIIHLLGKSNISDYNISFCFRMNVITDTLKSDLNKIIAMDQHIQITIVASNCFVASNKNCRLDGFWGSLKIQFLELNIIETVLDFFSFYSYIKLK
eukprot:TRINITY_DN14155_c0_g1_i1.p1 TRINITY_DN14155_c0_g1~~TRINITY_DN14155_c0_g1_i1.p1  ORF type:complete len:119 (-),score=6.87 TRINITY_DN14155_c0_g1_i1:41-397(-)